MGKTLCAVQIVDNGYRCEPNQGVFAPAVVISNYGIFNNHTLSLECQNVWTRADHMKALVIALMKGGRIDLDMRKVFL